MSEKFQFSLPDEEAMINFGRLLAEATQCRGVVYLIGDLGMGKTTLSRGVLQGFGHKGSVKSPTYTLVEPYELDDYRVYHFDLYRLSDPEELEYLGIRDYFEEDALCLVEWPDKGKGILPQPDLTIHISLDGYGRKAEWCASTDHGKQLAVELKNLVERQK